MMLMRLFQKSIQAWSLVEGVLIQFQCVLLCIEFCFKWGLYALRQLLKSLGRSTAKNYELDQIVF